MSALVAQWLEQSTESCIDMSSIPTYRSCFSVFFFLTYAVASHQLNIIPVVLCHTKKCLNEIYAAFDILTCTGRHILAEGIG